MVVDTTDKSTGGLSGAVCVGGGVIQYTCTVIIQALAIHTCTLTVIDPCV